MQKLRMIAEEATTSISNTLDTPLRPEQVEKIEAIVEKTIIEAVLDGLNRAIDTCKDCADADQDMAHKFSRAIEEKNIAVMANLESLR